MSWFYVYFITDNLRYFQAHDDLISTRCTNSNKDSLMTLSWELSLDYQFP